jgi:hypothetical protein
MVREPHESEVCPLCNYQVIQFGLTSEKIYRCLRKGCAKSKDGVNGKGGGIILEEDLVDKKENLQDKLKNVKGVNIRYI